MATAMCILFGIIYFFLYRVPEERDIYRGDVDTVMPISWEKSIHNVTQEKKASPFTRKWQPNTYDHNTCLLGLMVLVKSLNLWERFLSCHSFGPVWKCQAMVMLLSVDRTVPVV